MRLSLFKWSHPLDCHAHGKKKQKKVNYKKTTTNIPFAKPTTAQMMTLSLVAMTGLQIYCITSAYLQWLFHPGEQAMAHGPLMFVICYMVVQNVYVRIYRKQLGGVITPVLFVWLSVTDTTLGCVFVRWRLIEFNTVCLGLYVFRILRIIRPSRLKHG